MAAHSSTLRPCIGTAWIAASDASMTFDPLSLQGLADALFTSLATAEATESSEHLLASSDTLLFERSALALGAVLAASEPYLN
jgi:hypothetical protein